ncbi:SRPBCC family protein [Arthrobacter sp. NPDC058130]|uniref:SRPBCC family protein n=1 Tax=Arthrobacter sp. NPDC058130 TaxID=3346353 RepID=UPI0036EEC4FD
MAPLEAHSLINARGSTVWEIITDAGNFAVWASGITDVTGDLRNGGTIRVRTRHAGGTSVRLRVEQVPGGVMTWTWGIPPRLGAFKRTFVLTPQDAMTLLVVRDEISGPLRTFIRSPFGAEEDLAGFVAAVKQRAEILG